MYKYINTRMDRGIELEQLNMFPKDWTDFEGISDSKRGFLMGNLLW